LALPWFGKLRLEKVNISGTAAKSFFGVCNIVKHQKNISGGTHFPACAIQAEA
jgi:hypothetical protein